jgi:hypothetical protein
VILAVRKGRSVTVGNGLTFTSSDVGNKTVYQFTGGTDTITLGA